MHGFFIQSLTYFRISHLIKSLRIIISSLFGEFCYLWNLNFFLVPSSKNIVIMVMILNFSIAPIIGKKKERAELLDPGTNGTSLAS